MPATSYVNREFTRPRLVLSACLELEACRYDGGRIPEPFVRVLLPYVDVIPICPEVEIGLGTPRDTIRLVADGEDARLVQPSTGEDLTDRMKNFAERFFAGLGQVDGFVLKSTSPSCGKGDARVYAKIEKSPTLRNQSGVFAEAVLDRFPQAAVESEGRLRNYPLRHHFLSRLFAYAELRTLERSVRELHEFQRRHKHLLMTYDQVAMKKLGAIAADAHQRPIDEAFEDYRAVFVEALEEPASHESYINSISHMYSHFRRKLSDGESGEFLTMLEEFREHRLPLHAILSVVRQWCARFEYDYFADQSLLEPYPRDLVLMRDSGKGVDF